MPRNTAGTYTAPGGNPVSAGSVIRSNWANTTVQDIGGELTNSLSRDGYGDMRAPLKVPDGSSAAPTFTFTNDPDSGTFLQSAGHVGMTITSTLVQLWTAATTAISNALTVAKGLTVTNSTTNGAGTTSTGNGTGAGVVATGGATGAGGTFAGGGSASGVTGTGGATGAGGTFTGGATSGAGVVATAAAGNSNGVTSTGHGTGAGIVATGGATGPGGSFTGGATAGSGVAGQGVDNGSGAVLVGGATGFGVSATGGGTKPGGTFANGTAATGAASQVAVELTNGHLSLVGVANPNKDVAFTNTLTPKNVCKAWAYITIDTVNTPTLHDGFNMGAVSVTPGSDTLTVAWAQAFPAATYACVACSQYDVAVASQSTTGATFKFYDRTSATAVDLDTVTGMWISIIVFAAQ